MKLLVLGAAGSLGRTLCGEAEARPGVSVAAATHGDCDITDPTAVSELVGRVRPDTVVLTAAYTNVDRAEQEPDTCFQVNVYGAENVARAAARVGARLVAFSTDFVFDGAKGAPYVEEDQVHPLSVYAASKAAMERALPAVCRDTLILRVGNLFGVHGRNFPARLPFLLAHGAPIRIDRDRTMAPTSTRALARQILALLQAPPPPGLYHAACHGRATWADFARLVADTLGLPLEAPMVPTEELGLVAKRPRSSVLRNRRLAWLGLDVMPTWQEATLEFCEAVRPLLAAET